MVTKAEGFPSNFFRAEDFLPGGKPGRPVKVMFAHIGMEEIENDKGKKEKVVATLIGQKKKWVINSTNFDALAALFGSGDSDNWIGKEIVLYSTPVPFGREMKMGVRTRPPKTNGGDAPAAVPVAPAYKQEPPPEDPEGFPEQTGSDAIDDLDV